MKSFTRISTIITLMLLFITAGLTAQELKKSYHETYDVNSDAKVQIDNKYGQVNIQTWDKNQVMIDVEISVDAKNEKESQKVLDKINAKISGSNDLVKAITVFTGKLNCRNCEMNIEYEVKMPASCMLDLKNEFGNAYVGELSGPAKIRVDYGNLELDGLTGKGNSVTVKFGNAEIGVVKASEMHIEYSNLELAKAGYLDLYSRFNDIEIAEVSELVLDSQYDGVEIGSGDDMNIKAGFSDIEIGEVFDKLILNSSYGGVEVLRVSGGFSLIDITSEFGSVDLGISKSASYKLEAHASFGDIDYPEGNASVIKEIEKDFKHEIEAFIGDDKSSSAKVNVSVKNADVDID